MRAALLLGLVVLAGCPHDLARPRRSDQAGVEAGPLDRAAAEPSPITDRPLPDTTCPHPCVSTLAGSCGGGGKEDGPARDARFSVPVGILLRGSALLVADRDNSAIRRIENGVVTTEVSLGGVYPTDLALDDQGRLLVLDKMRSQVLRIDNNTPVLVVGTANGMTGMIDGPASEARLNHPAALLGHPNLGLLIADTDNGCVRMLAAGQVSTLVKGVEALSGLALRADGALFISQPYAVQSFSGGTLTPFAGGTTYGLVNGPAADARFNGANGMVLDSTGALFVADAENHVIRRIANGQVSTHAGTGDSAYQDGPGAQAKFFRPVGLAIDGADVLYVSDPDGDCIRMIR
jgi:hypothetical protein